MARRRKLHVNESPKETPENDSPAPDRKQEKVVYRDWRYHHHEPGSVVWGILLLFIGGTFLLNNLGIVPWTVWDHIWRFWPVLLLIAGVQVLLGSIPGTGLIIGLLAVALFLMVWTRALLEINSPLVTQWGLTHAPWFEFVKNFKIK